MKERTENIEKTESEKMKNLRKVVTALVVIFCAGAFFSLKGSMTDFQAHTLESGTGGGDGEEVCKI